MKRTWLYCLITFVAGLASGAFATLLIYPFIFPPAEVNEQIVNAGQKQVVALGLFIHANPSDPIHWGRGGLEIYKGGESYEILLKEDFEVGAGPDYRIYLSSEKHIKTSNDFENSETYELSRLKSFKGSQVYPVSNDVDLKKFNSVVIWCKSFSQLISPAELTH